MVLRETPAPLPFLVPPACAFLHARASVESAAAACRSTSSLRPGTSRPLLLGDSSCTISRGGVWPARVQLARSVCSKEVIRLRPARRPEAGSASRCHSMCK